MIILTTERLLLRELQSFDAEAMERIFCDEEVMASSQGVQTKEWIREWLVECRVDYYEKRGYGPWAVEEKVSGATIGYCGLFYFPDVNGQPEIEIGYRLARASWSKGYATEAVQAVRDYAFETLDIERLIAIIEPLNARSVRVAEKAGMQHESDVMFDWYDHPDHVYVVTRAQAG